MSVDSRSSLLGCVLWLLPSPALPQDPVPVQDPAAVPAAASARASVPKVEVPTFANKTCPIMGKKVSLPLFVDTELGRIYLCCKPCVKDVLADVATAHRTAYPVVQPLANDVCPVSGEPIGEDAETLVLQGVSFRVCCAGCAAEARTHAQRTLVRLLMPVVQDVGNATCPVTGEKATANAFVLIGDAMVHLANPKLVAEVGNDPVAVLAKARGLAAKQPKAPPHRHQKQAAAPASAPAAPPAEGGK